MKFKYNPTAELADSLIMELWEKVQVLAEANKYKYIGGTPTQFLDKKIDDYLIGYKYNA